MIRRAALLASALALAGCSPAGFDAASPEAFRADCVGKAFDLGRRIGADPGLVAAVFGMFSAGPDVEAPGRRFDPAQPPAVAGSDAIAGHDPVAACAALEPSRQRLAAASAQDAFAAGVSNWLAALGRQRRDVSDLDQSIKDAVDGRKKASGRVADLIGRFAPRGTEFRSVRRGARMVPTVVVEAVNPLDLPIEAFFFALDLKRPDGSLVASGRFTFRPPTPLAAGVAATYVISLDGIAGFVGPEIEDLRSKVDVKVRTEDVVSGGRRLLADSLVDPKDRSRIESLGVLKGRIEEVRDFLRRMRVALS